MICLSDWLIDWYIDIITTFFFDNGVDIDLVVKKKQNNGIEWKSEIR